MKIKHMCHGGVVTDTKIADRNGVPVGIIEGYIATWDVDRGDGWSDIKDQFMPGAFTKAIARHKATDRQIRFKDHHGRTVGGFPIKTVKQDDRGLFGIAEVNLEVRRGAEVFSLAKQKVLTDFSIGWGESEFEVEDGIRKISESEVWEGSIVDEPMNPLANITAVKSVDFSELDVVDIRAIEHALKTGIKFSDKEAKKIISYFKSVGVLRDEQDDHRDGELVEKMDQILTNLKEFKKNV